MTLNLLFPQWQGAGKGTDLYIGALEIRDALLPEGRYEQINVSLDTELIAKHGIWAYDAILAQLKRAVDCIARVQPGKIFTIGGCCGIEIAPVSYLNELYGGDLAVIWFDAHGDLNTPESSPSGYFHGMPLRTLLGDGDEQIIGQCFSRLTSRQVVLAGCRELDPAEDKYICENTITVIRPDELAFIADVMKAKGSKNVYVHLDLDVIDPECFSSVMCPTENGVAFDDLMDGLQLIKREFNIVGFSIVEYKQSNNAHVEQLKEIIAYGYNL